MEQYREDWRAFEKREPGYLKALYIAFQAIFHFNTPIDIDYILLLHKLATEGVHRTNYQLNRTKLSRKGAFRQDDVNAVSFELSHYESVPDNATLAGVYQLLEDKNPFLMFSIATKNRNFKLRDVYLTNELIDRLRRCFVMVKEKKHFVSDDDFWDALIKFAYIKNVSEKNKSVIVPILKKIAETENNDQLANYLFEVIKISRYRGAVRVKILSGQRKNVESILTDEMQKYVDYYHDSIAIARNRIEKLYAIIIFIQSCEQLHPFYDANCRTFCMLLLNHLLMRNGFPPAILTNPNRFDAFSRDELLIDVLDGMKESIAFIKGEESSCVKTTNIVNDLGQSQTQSDQMLKNYFDEIVNMEDFDRDRTCKISTLRI
ncbi:MAG: Fic family protein [Gammaproteobacteria bacterium]|nr:Fic family protein [Gammaproteobacteria bacterium]